MYVFFQFSSCIKLAITAGSPIHRGYLTDVDCRWGMMAEALDDRTPEERDVCMF